MAHCPAYRCSAALCLATPPRPTSALALHAGLWIYDHLGGRDSLPESTAIDLSRHPAGIPLSNQFVPGWEFSDCRVDDAGS